LGDAYELGLVQAVGVSNYGSAALKACHAKLAARGIPLASNQVGEGGGEANSFRPFLSFSDMHRRTPERTETRE
jgi:hypothetical protein